MSAPVLPSTILRAAQSTDAGAVGAILSGFVDDTPWMPRVHSHAEDLSFAGTMIDRGWVRVAERDGTIEAFLARNGRQIHALYVRASAQSQGLGTALLRDAQVRQEALDLFTFQANTGAQRFYLRHGFAEVARSDGAGNDEGLPDIQYRWIKAQEPMR